MAGLVQRPRYVPSGRVWGHILLPLVLALALLSLLGGLFLHGLFVQGWYLYIVAPLLPALCIGWILAFAIRRSHCRNRALAMAIAASCFLLAYASQFYFGLIREIGIENAHRVDLVHRYFLARMESDGSREPGRSRPTPQEATPFENWLWRGVEFGAMLWFIVLYAGRTAGRAYCEVCGDWKSRRPVFLLPGAGKAVVEALDTGMTGHLLRLPLGEWHFQSPYCALLLEHCRDEAGVRRACPCFLTVREVTRSGVGEYNKIDGALGQWLVRQVELRGEEVTALLGNLPDLRSQDPRAAAPETAGTQGPA